MANINTLIQEIVNEYGIDENDVPELSETLAMAIDDIAKSFLEESETFDTSGLSSIPGGGDVLTDNVAPDNDVFEEEPREFNREAADILSAVKQFEKLLLG